MSISSGSKILASDINSVKTDVKTAVETVGKTCSWSNTISAGGLAKISALSEIQTQLSSANSSYKTDLCSANYTGNLSCASQRSNNTGCSDKGGNSAYRNNKCGGEADYGLEQRNPVLRGLYN